MNNLETIEIFKATRDECQHWNDSALLLLSGSNIDHLEEPQMSSECQLGKWVTASIQTVNHYTELAEIKVQHDKCHNVYNNLYDEALRIYNPKTHDELQSLLEDLEHETAKLLYYLNQAEEQLADDPNAFTAIISEDDSKTDETVGDDIILESEINNDPATTNEKIIQNADESDLMEINISEESKTDDLEIDVIPLLDNVKQKHIGKQKDTEETTPSIQLDEVNSDNDIEVLKTELLGSTDTITNEIDSDVQSLKDELTKPANFDEAEQTNTTFIMQDNFQQQLKEHDLKQIELEKELTLRELDTLKERQHLNTQAVNRLKQHLLLIQQDISNQDKKYEETVSPKHKEQEELQQKLDKIIDDYELKQKELAEMEQANIKLEDNKEQRLKFEKFVQQQIINQTELDQLTQEKKIKLNKIEELQDKISILNGDVQHIITIHKVKSDEFDKIESQKNECENLIEQDEVKQLKINQHIKELDVVKTDAVALEEKKSNLTLQTDLIATELIELEQNRKNTKEQTLTDVKQLNEQQKTKIDSLKHVEKSLLIKEQELSRLEEQYCMIKHEVNKHQNNEQSMQYKNDQHSKNLAEV